MFMPMAFLYSAPSDLYPCSGTDCNFSHLIMLVKGIFSRLLKYAFILAPILISYAGYLYLTSYQNPGDRNKAKNILQDIAIGLAVMILAWTIISLFLKIFANDQVIDLSPINPNKP